MGTALKIRKKKPKPQNKKQTDLVTSSKPNRDACFVTAFAQLPSFAG